MQQYDVNKKKRKTTLFISYIAMTLAVIAISAVSILLALGYRFDFSSNKVEQGALIQLGSFPDSAQITLDSKIQTFKTNGKIEVSTGAHDVVFHKDGYRDWSKHFTLKAGEVRWLNYARLVPTTITTGAVKEVGTVTSELASPDKSFIVVLPVVNLPNLTVIKVNDPAKVTATTITVPAVKTTLSGQEGSYRLVEWNLGSKYFLVRHDIGTAKEFLRINATDPNDIVNITSKFGVPLTEAHFSSESVFYGLENGNLRKLDLNASSLSEPIVKDVITMKLYGSNEVAYVRHANTKFEVGVVVDGQNRIVSTYDDTVPVNIDFGQYFREYYLAITRGGSFELIKNPERTENSGMAKVVTLSYPSDLKWLDISPSGRFVITGSGAQFLMYDIELATRTDTNFPSLLADTTVPPQWLDDFTLVSTGDNKLRLSDFDGENQQIITDVLPTQPVMLSTDKKLLYSFSKNSNGTAVLQASKLTIE